MWRKEEMKKVWPTPCIIKKKRLLFVKEPRKYYKTDQTRFGDIAIYELP